MTYGVSHRSPLAQSGVDPTARPRHCAYCGAGLSETTRARLSAEDRLILAIFGEGPTCVTCAPAVLARATGKP